MADTKYSWSAELWVWSAKESATWCFVSVPNEQADEIEERFGRRAGGFGSVRVEVTIGGSTWRTSLFPSNEERTYVLPVKKPVRKAEGLEPGDTADITIEVLLDEP